MSPSPELSCVRSIGEMLRRRCGSSRRAVVSDATRTRVPRVELVVLTEKKQAECRSGCSARSCKSARRREKAAERNASVSVLERRWHVRVQEKRSSRGSRGARIVTPPAAAYKHSKGSRAPPGCRLQNVKPQNRKGEATEKEDRAATLLRLWLALRCSAKTVNAWQSWPSGSAQSRFARSEDFDEAGPSIPPLRCQAIGFGRYWSPWLLIRLASHFQLDQTQRETKAKKAARSGSARGSTRTPGRAHSNQIHTDDVALTLALDSFGGCPGPERRPNGSRARVGRLHDTSDGNIRARRTITVPALTRSPRPRPRPCSGMAMPGRGGMAECMWRTKRLSSIVHGSAA
ncbi:hypothetical protein L1887_62110 [Cichorium endivia]|nr:hypothetical protein L1887_62110 [Cichorium endivia]